MSKNYNKKNSKKNSSSGNKRNYDKDDTKVYEKKSKSSKGLPFLTDDKHNCGDAKADINDAQWYFDPRGIVAEAARINTFLPSGRPYYSTDLNDNDDFISTVSAMVTHWLPCPGASEDGTSAMSIAGQLIFQQIRKVLNKPIADYGFADPMIAYICYLSIMTLVEEIKREYGIMNTYSTQNLSYPTGVLHALGYSDTDIVDLRSNMADYRMQFNTLMYKLSAIYMPVETNIGMKYRWLARNLWIDHDSVKGQIYMYQATGFYEWQDTGSEGSTAHYFQYYAKRTANQPMMAYKLDLLNYLIEQIRNSDSYNYLCSDMMRAFPDAKTYNWENLVEDYMVFPAVNDDMLQQFENVSTISKVGITGINADVTQDVNANTVLCKPTIFLNDSLAYFINEWANDAKVNGVFTDFLGTNPSIDDIVEFTHGKHIINMSGKTIEFTPGTFSCALYLWTDIHWIQRARETGEISYQNADASSYLVLNDNRAVFNMARIAECDWHPLVFYAVEAADEGGSYQPALPFGEIDNLIRIPMASLKRMFEAEQFALWKVPEDVLPGKIG
nr:putative capsid [Marmot picobirnavirus]